MTLTIVTAHWKEDLEWLKKSPFPVVLIDKIGSAPSPFTPQFITENHGLNVSTILAYIVHNYDSLPEHMAFLHGHENSYHQMHDRHILDVISGANIEKYGFITLNNMMRIYPFYNEESNVPDMPGLMLKDHWIRLGFKPLPDNYTMHVPVGSQFIVARERILRWPKARWQEWLDLLMKSEKQQEFIWIVVFEYILHFILGESPNMEIASDWFSFPYHIKWWHEIPQLCYPEHVWRSMGLEPLEETSKTSWSMKDNFNTK